MEVNSNAREYEPRPVLATGGGVLARLNVATSCSARKDDARRVALILVVGVVVMLEEMKSIVLMSVLSIGSLAMR